MITKTTGYQSSDGVVHATIEEAQKAEIRCILMEMGVSPGPWDSEYIEDFFILHRAEILDILTMTPKSRPKARSINGAKKTRKPKTTVIAQEAQAA